MTQRHQTPPAPLHTRPQLDIVTRGDSGPRSRLALVLLLCLLGATVTFILGGTLPSFTFQSAFERDFQVTTLKQERGPTTLSTTTWIISGTLVNSSHEPQTAPDLTVRLLRTDTQKEVATTRVSLGQQALPKGAGVRFSTRLRAPAGQDITADVTPVAPAATSDVTLIPDNPQEDK